MFRSTDDAVTWHSAIANRFDARYRSGRMFRERLAIWESVIRSAVRPGHAVADLGCGSGILTVVAARTASYVIGIDGSAEMVELARSRAISEKLGNVSILESRLEQFPGLISSPVDVIICSSVIEYLSDPDSFVEACYAVLRPGGSLILSVPNGASIYRWAETFIFHFTKRPLYRAFVKAVEPPRVMAARLRRAGFELQSTSYFGRIALLSLLLRAVGRAAAMDTMALFVARKP